MAFYAGELILLTVLPFALSFDPCTNFKLIDEAYRSTGYRVQDIFYSHLICDRMMTRGWYKFSNGNTMPTSCIDLYHCGTHVPIWLDGRHPSVHEGVVSRQVCGHTPDGGCCGYRSSIQVKNCGAFYVYELIPTRGCSIAYCAGSGVPCPPDKWSSSGFQPGCQDAYPKILQSPQLSNPIIKPAQSTFEFNCHIPFDSKRTDVGFEVVWLFDGHPDTKVPSTKLTGTTRDTVMDQMYLEGHLGKELTCAVSAYFATSPGRKGPRIPSNGYWCGIKLSEGRLTVGENEKEREVRLISTIPIVCNKQSSASCRLEVYLDPNNHDIRQTTSCTQTFQDYTKNWNPLTNEAVVKFNVLAERDFVKDGDKNLELHFNQIFSVDAPPVFNNYQIPFLQIQTKDKLTSMCRCTGDPHCITLDQQLDKKRHYNYYKIGEFTMYKSQNRAFEVQVRTWQCNKVSCNCAVIMREGNDVIRIDMCHGHYGKTFPKLTIQHQGQISQGTVVQKDSAGKNWMVYFPSGAWVKVVNHRGISLDVYIQAPEEDFDSTQGLCGTFDGRTDNDLTMSNGHVQAWSSKPDAFVESWRVPVGTSMFDKDVPIDVKLDNDMYYCNCDQKKKLNDCRVDGKASRPAIHTRCVHCNTVAQGTAATGRKRRQASTPQDNEPMRYIYDYGFLWSPLTLDFPTKSGKTKADATDICNDAFNKVSAIRECVAIAGMNFTSEIGICVEDIKVSDEETFVDSAIDSAIMSCMEVVLKDLSFYDNATGLPPAFITSDLCPSHCSGNGVCIHGTCHCQSGFKGDGCEIDTTRPPYLFSIVSFCIPKIPDEIITNLESFVTDDNKFDMYNVPYTTAFSLDSDLCDVTKKPCQTIYVVGDNMLESPNMRCQLEELEFNKATQLATTGRNHSVTVDHQTMYNVGCKMPSKTENRGRTVIAYDISLSNDGIHYSNTTRVIIIDSTCMTCSTSGGNCQLKPNTCLIDGNCRSAGETNQLNPSLSCDPTYSSETWTDGDALPTLPPAPQGGVLPTRFDLWTTSKTGCTCASNTSKTYCACCDDGACQCTGSNSFQCVQCGHDENCGKPIPAPENGIDGYTLAFSDCSCKFNYSRSDCACCHHGGCQCGVAHQNQCVNCNHMELCGSKSWIFGPAFPSN